MRALEPLEVHIWTAALDDGAADRQCSMVLSDAERERGARFAFAHLRRRYVIAHGFLRGVLAKYLGVAPASIAFETGPHGKPFIAAADLEFNLSHSGDLAVCAVTRGARIGVDVECRREVLGMEGIVSRFFAEGEAEKIRLSADPNRTFLQYWTRKEAYIKALGGGFSIPLPSFDTSGTLPGWTFAEFLPGGEYIGAVAAEGKIRQLELRRWSACEA